MIVPSLLPPPTTRATVLEMAVGAFSTVRAIPPGRTACGTEASITQRSVPGPVNVVLRGWPLA